MSVTVIRPPRRSKKDQTHTAHLARLGSKAAQIRHACDVVSRRPGPLTVPVVRTWLAEHGVAEDPDDLKRRAYVSKIVNNWRREHGLSDAADDQSDTDQTAEAHTGPVPDVHTPPVPDVHTPPVPDVHTEPVPSVYTDPAMHTPEPETVHTPAVSDAHAGLSVPSTRAGARLPDPALVQRSRRLRFASYGVLSLVAAAGAVLSYKSLRDRAAEVFPDALAAVFPLLVDALIVGASLAYLAGAVLGRGRPGWRLTAHAGVAGTLVLNALASKTLTDVPWHIAAPLVWSALVELTARDLLGDYRATHARPDSIPFALWLTAPGESASTWLRVRRQAAHAAVRVDVGAHAAAREALRMALPGYRARRVRRVISRQLRAGSVTPAAVLEQTLAITDRVRPDSPQAVLRDVLAHAVGVPTGPAHSPKDPVSTARAGGGLVKARQQDIDRLRTAVRSAHRLRREPRWALPTGPVTPLRMARGAAPNPATKRALRNPYIDITPADTKPETLIQEAISVVKSESQRAVSRKDAKNSFRKSEEPQTYATPLT
jgi:hypothetical protein